MRDPEAPSADKVFTIRKSLIEYERRLLQEWPILKHQDAIGFAIFIGATALVCAAVWGLAADILSIASTIPIVAFAASLLHELEHDLIHQLYFRKSVWVQHVMFTGIWLCKLSLNPWARKEIHLLHHKWVLSVDVVILCDRSSVAVSPLQGFWHERRRGGTPYWLRAASWVRPAVLRVSTAHRRHSHP